MCLSLCVCPSAQLLDCFVIPVVLLLSWFFLLVRYKAVHFVGAGLCLLGVGCMVGADILLGRQQGLGECPNVLLIHAQQARLRVHVEVASFVRLAVFPTLLSFPTYVLLHLYQESRSSLGTSWSWVERRSTRSPTSVRSSL